MNKQKKEEKLTLIDIILIGLFSYFVAVGFITIVNRFHEQVVLRKLNILKTKYEIMRLSCGNKGGEFIEKNWSVTCN